MPFDRPDLQTLITRITADLTSRFPGYNRLRRTVISVFARVLAGLAHGLYGYLDWLSNQILPDTMEAARLLRYGAIMGVTYPVAAKASGMINVTGTNGALIPVGTLWQRADGTEYIVTAQAVMSGGAASVAVAAVEYGAVGNALSGVAVVIVSPISGVNPDAVVGLSGLTGGADAMDIETYRARVIERMATSYTGSNAAIYQKWAKEIGGVTRAWVYENTPAQGTVTVLFVCDDQAGSIMPGVDQVAAVLAYLNEHTDPFTGQLVGRAVNATLVVAGPTSVAVNFTILPTPDTPAVRSAISASLTDYLRREASPGEDLFLSRIRAAIITAGGVTDYTLTAPSTNVSISDGHIAVLGAITWAL